MTSSVSLLMTILEDKISTFFIFFIPEAEKEAKTAYF